MTMIYKAVTKLRRLFTGDADEIEDYVPRVSDGLPPALEKSFLDCPFDYAVILRDGKVIEYESAEWAAHGWVRLCGVVGKIDGCNFERGLEVRLDDIMACADAPHGS